MTLLDLVEFKSLAGIENLRVLIGDGSSARVQVGHRDITNVWNIARYSRSVWQMVKEALEELGELTGPTAAEYFRDHYPRDTVNEGAIKLQLIACSVNHTSARQFDAPDRFLRYLGDGRHMAYDPVCDEAKTEPGWKVIRVTRPGQQEPRADETPFSRVEAGTT